MAAMPWHEVPYKRQCEERAFLMYHAAHPQFLLELIEIARDLKRYGVAPQVASVWTLIHQWRWRSLVAAATPGAEVPVLPRPRNAFAPYFARVIPAVALDLRGYLITAPMQIEYVPDVTRPPFAPRRLLAPSMGV